MEKLTYLNNNQTGFVPVVNMAELKDDSHIVIMTLDEWNGYKNNMPILTSDAAMPEQDSVEDYEGETERFEELTGDHLKSAITFMLDEIRNLDEDYLGDNLKEIIEDQVMLVKTLGKDLEKDHNFVLGSLHRIPCFQIYPEPKTLKALVENEITAQALAQAEEQLKETGTFDVNKVSIKENLSDYLDTIKAWYSTRDGMKDYCDTMDFSFAKKDGTPLV